eukprot:6198025-Pleurochrysis_carterae.AAC.1
MSPVQWSLCARGPAALHACARVVCCADDWLNGRDLAGTEDESAISLADAPADGGAPLRRITITAHRDDFHLLFGEHARPATTSVHACRGSAYIHAEELCA